MADAVVIGAGPNGLVAANMLAERGWAVVVLEAEAEPGGAVRSAEMVPGHVHDVFSGFYPLAVASPPLARLQLEDWGLRWRRAPLALAHPFPDGRCAVISTDPAVTAASVESFGAGDGDRWMSLVARWREVSDQLLRALLDGPFPPVRASARLAATLGPADLVRFARFCLLPVRRMCAEEQLHPGATMLLAGNALHSDLTPDLPLSGLFGWLLAMLAQEVGFPVAEGGSSALTTALVRRLQAHGGTVLCNQAVTGIEIRRGRAQAVRTATGDCYPARRAVLADVAAPVLYRDLVGEQHLTAQRRDDLARFHLDNSTFKVDWLLDGPAPWTAEQARAAGTVHLADDLAHLSTVGLRLSEGEVTDKPFLIVGQTSVADPTRTPDGSQLMWAYTHVPQRTRGLSPGGGPVDAGAVQQYADRLEERIEEHAPGFRSVVRERRVLSPFELRDGNRSLVGGAVNGGTAALHQQLLFRPLPGLGRPETGFAGLYLASSSAHPGGGVHGACGANAARAALAHHRAGRAVVAAGAALATTATVTRRGRSDGGH